MGETVSGPPSVKILCGGCGRLLCRVYDTPEGRAYWITGGHGGWASGPGGVFCADHGWPDLADPKLAAKLALTGKVPTHRAKMRSRPPVPH
jgi:hypothetical protein